MTGTASPLATLLDARLVPCGKVAFVVDGPEAGRTLLAWASRALPQGECIVAVRAMTGTRRSFRQVPRCASAELVAIEPAEVLRGGFTWQLTYWRMPVTERACFEEHLSEGRVVRTEENTLEVVVVGHAAPEIVSVRA